MKKLFSLILVLIVLLSVIVFASPQNEKVLYLTFDDGPSKNTPEILKILDKYNAKATFFLLNDNMKNYPDYVKLIQTHGHSVGLHGASHDVNVIYNSPSEPLEEMNLANNTLYSILGCKTKLIRTPYGSYPYMSLDQYKILTAAGYNLWDWNVDPRDGVGTPTMDCIMNNIKHDLKGNSSPIILLHDRKSTAQKLDSLLSYLSEQGYKFESITEKMTPVNFMELYGPAKKK